MSFGTPARRLLAALVVASVAPGQGGAGNARAALVEQLASADAIARNQAYNALQRDRDAEVIALVGKRLPTLPPEGQQLALFVLQQRPLDATRAVYTQLLAADRALVRAHAAAALARGGDRGQLATLAKALAAAPREDRMATLNTAWSLDAPEVVAAIRGYVRADEAPHVLVAALDRLQQAEKGASAATRAVVEPLATATTEDVRAAALAWLLGDDDGAKRAAALAPLLASLPRFWLVERLLPRTRALPPVLADAIAAALAAPRSQFDVTQLTPLLKAAAPERLRDALRGLLAHANADVRGAAIAALAAVPGGLEPKELHAMLQSGAPDQQLAVAATLRRMDDLAGLPVALRLAQQPGPHRAKAVETLGGFRSRDVVPPLLDALAADDAAVRQKAWASLQSVVRDLFPYRRFAFDQCGYEPNGADRGKGVAALRAWWASVP